MIMIWEFLFMMWLAAIGIVATQTFWTYDRYGLAAVGPVIGAALYALSGLVLFAVGYFATISAMLVATAVAIVVAVIGRTRHRTSEAGDIMVALGVVGVFAAAIVVFMYVYAPTRLSPDSIDYLVIAGGLERFGAIPELTIDQILKRQFVIPVLHTAGVVTGLGHFASQTMLLVSAGFASMLWLGWRALRSIGLSIPRVVTIGAIVGAFIITTDRVLYNVFYINGHGFFAAFMVVGIGLIWLAVDTDEWQMVVPASLALAAIVPLRAEGIIVLAMFLVPFMASRAVPNGAVWTIVAPIAVTAFVWNGAGLTSVLPSSEYGLSSTPVVAMGIGAALVGAAAVRHVQPLRRYLAWVPLASFVLLALYTGARMVRGRTSLYLTLEAMGSNIAAAGFWSTFWWVAPAAIVACVAVVHVRKQSIVLWGLAMYPIAIITFTYLRGSPYRVGPGDSGNRMLMHVVFVIGLYLIVALGHLAERIPKGDITRRTVWTDVKEALTVD